MEPRWRPPEKPGRAPAFSPMMRWAKNNIVSESLLCRSVTFARGAFDGYRKGRRFYRFVLISAEAGGAASICDVDHLCPHALAHLLLGVNVDGMRNLVLMLPRMQPRQGQRVRPACARADLGLLNCRNEYLIFGQHLLRDALIAQTGPNARVRQCFLEKVVWSCRRRGRAPDGPRCSGSRRNI